VKSWNEFAALRPDLAEPGRALLYRVGVGLAYLATTRPDGAPRVHPMCPVATGGTRSTRSPASTTKMCSR
jgi:hypothetical protein